MRVKVGAKALNEKLSKFDFILKVPSPDPVMRNIKIDVDQDRMVMVCMNTKYCLREYIVSGFYVDSPFSFMVDAVAFVSFIKKHKDGELMLEVDAGGKFISVSYPTGSFDIPCDDTKAFPDIQDKDIRWVMSVPMSSYVGVFKNASKFTSVNILYPVIENVMIDIDNTGINIISTDLNSIYRHMMPNTGDISPVSIQISGMMADILDSHIKKAEDVMSIGVSGNRTYVRLSEADLSEIQVTGEFPNWRYIDSNFNKVSKYVFDKDLFFRSFKNISKIDEFDHVIISFFGDRCIIKSENLYTGAKCQDTLIPMAYEGDGFECRIICSRCLIPAKIMESDKIILEHDTKTHVNKIYGEGFADKYVIFSSIINH